MRQCSKKWLEKDEIIKHLKASSLEVAQLQTGYKQVIGQTHRQRGDLMLRDLRLHTEWSHRGGLVWREVRRNQCGVVGGLSTKSSEYAGYHGIGVKEECRDLQPLESAAKAWLYDLER